MSKTYLFYDLETTGLNKAFDQVLQFAAIRTDLALNEIERHEFFITLNPDVVPSPYAVITHLIDPTDIQGHNELVGIEKIHEIINTPGTISLGYNTLGFDDEFLRFSFYRNLLPPYTHQYANDCSRMDLYPMTVMYYLFKHEAINWPKRGLKLEGINEANQFIEGQAHNALVDVEATVALARAFKKHGEMWDYLSGYFHKNTDSERLLKLPQALPDLPNRYGLMVLPSIGISAKYQSLVLALGNHFHYNNQSLWLRLDQVDLPEILKNDYKEAWVFRKKLAEPGFILPPTERFLAKIPEETLQIVEANKQWFKDHPELFKELCHYFQNYTYPDIENVDVDAALYINGFPTPADNKISAQFHQLSLAKKIALLDEFSNDSLQEQAVRIIGRHHTDQLPDKFQEHYTDYLDNLNNTVDFQGHARLTKEQALDDIKIIVAEKKLSSTQQTLLTKLTDLLTQ